MAQLDLKETTREKVNWIQLNHHSVQFFDRATNEPISHAVSRHSAQHLHLNVSWVRMIVTASNGDMKMHFKFWSENPEVMRPHM
jgi:hypothetical protein